MAWNPILKPTQDWRVVPNLVDYDATRAAFSWEAARRQLDGLPGGRGLNIAHEAVDRHANGPRRAHLALRWLGKHGGLRDFTYGDLHALSNRFANVLRILGVRAGDRVFALSGRIPELYIAALGTLKLGGVFCPLFSAFGPEPIRQRLAIGEGTVLITTNTLYMRRKINELRHALPQLKHIIVVSVTGDVNARESGAAIWRYRGA
jgi:acetyl-CoA synthetase